MANGRDDARSRQEALGAYTPFFLEHSLSVPVQHKQSVSSDETKHATVTDHTWCQWAHRTVGAYTLFWAFFIRSNQN